MPTNSKRPPALTPEADESIMINLAMNQARRQMEEGSAPSQVVTHFLKLAAEKERQQLELEKMEKEIELLKAKTDAIESAKQMGELYKEAIAAIKTYNGGAFGGDEYEDEDWDD